MNWELVAGKNDADIVLPFESYNSHVLSVRIYPTQQIFHQNVLLVELFNYQNFVSNN